MIQETIQQELASAVRGFIKGMTEFSQEQIAETVQEEIQIAVNPESQFKNGLQQLQEKRTEAFESKLNEMKQETDEYVKSFKLNDIPVELVADEKTREMVAEAHQAGIDPVQVNKFKKYKPACNTVYQRFTRNNKGVKGAWRQYVETVLNESMN
jgi:imidazolonepropionase-like amidohydrolase